MVFIQWIGLLCKTMSVLEKFKAIRTFVFDVDGVMTDGSVIVTDSGEQRRTMNTKDGYSLQLAVK